MSVQSQYRNLHHLSFWEMAISNLALWQVEESLKCWRSLHKESTVSVLTTQGCIKLNSSLQWSKAVYAYGVAALLVQLGGEANRAEALKLMIEVPKLRQRIAGKSIPLEKFVARKARKCEAQGGRLILPALELAYFLHSVSPAPRSVIAEKMLPLVEAALVELERCAAAPEKYGRGGSVSEFWDDWCLARQLEGACLRYIAYPVRFFGEERNLPFADGLARGRVPMHLLTRTRSCRFLKRTLPSVLAPRSRPYLRMGPRFNSIITLCISPVSSSGPPPPPLPVTELSLCPRL